MSSRWIGFLILVLSCQQGEVHNLERKSLSLEKVYPYALRGEMGVVLNMIDSLNDENLSDSDRRSKDLFIQRFEEETEQVDFKTEDAAIIEFVKLFQFYWKSVMLEKASLEEADHLLEQSLTDFLFRSNSDGLEKELIANDLYRYCNDFLENRGYYSNAFGKTSHLYDLFLWKTDRLAEYEIKLVDDSVKVIVHFMNDFISKGWTHYATLGKNYASGWATSEALFTMEDAYDLHSENFTVSYLIHEGQHFSDYKSFPNLKQVDLEYRAKLVELIQSKESTLDILEKFLYNASSSEQNAHGYANHTVIKNLSEKIFNVEYEKNKQKWSSVDRDLLRKESKILFNEYNQALEQSGSTTQSIILNFLLLAKKIDL